MPNTPSQAGPSTPPRSLPNSGQSRYSARKSVNPDSAPWKRTSGPLNTRDELIMSLMASEAVIDSRDYDILSTEEVEELKKEHQVLSSRLGAMTKKLATETKIRDAAVSLSKVNSTQIANKKVSKQTAEQLEAANRRVETAQRELWKVSERHNEVHRRLMEHRAGVLSLSVHNLEKKIVGPGTPSIGAHDDSGYDSLSNRSTLLSPASSTMSGVSSSSKARFDGAHLFAGHADTIVPKTKLSADAAAAEITLLEEKLKKTKDALVQAGKKQADMSSELTLLKLEKQELEATMGLDLQAAEETIAALEKEVPRLESMDQELRILQKEKLEWEKKRRSLETKVEEKVQEADELRERIAQEGEAADGAAERMLQDLRNQMKREADEMKKEAKEKEREIQRLKKTLEEERATWEAERRNMEDEKIDDLARLQEEIDRQREQEGKQSSKQAEDELEAGLSTIQSLIEKHSIVIFSRNSSLTGLLKAIGSHIDTVHKKLDAHSRAEKEWDNIRRRLEADVRAGLDKREELAKELEEVRRERDSARRETLTLSLEHQQRQSKTMGTPRTGLSHLRTTSTASSYAGLSPIEMSPAEDKESELERWMGILQPLWAIMPSPEARAARISANSNSQRGYHRASSSANNTSPTANGSPTPGQNGATSLSDMDVRSLKVLYEKGAAADGPGSPKPGPFTIEAFAQRVQALVSDDRALIERLIRFAKAHDLLKQNAERAQKLAQEGTNALETYQKQVRLLEERNVGMANRLSIQQEELSLLHSTIERMTAERRDLEERAAEQAEQCAQLTEANNTLSARTLTLAEEAAHAPEYMRRQMEVQLAEAKKQLDETKKQLEVALEEIDGMRNMEQSQRIALLDELNTMQTENASLRAQLRAIKK
ncbi:Up-regulated during septation-domain-containing protein [Panaeolus papilionaceus]|nr:Up-regulated during septation-domain-containing protein [Panaeolus papilionaceus]